MSHRDNASTSDLPNRCIDEGRHMRIIISEQIHADLAAADYDLRMIQHLGAGFSGILAAIRFRQKFTNIELVLYEKNAGVGGTW